MVISGREVVCYVNMWSVGVGSLTGMAEVSISWSSSGKSRVRTKNATSSLPQYAVWELSMLMQVRALTPRDPDTLMTQSNRCSRPRRVNLSMFCCYYKPQVLWTIIEPLAQLFHKKTRPHKLSINLTQANDLGWCFFCSE